MAYDNHKTVSRDFALNFLLGAEGRNRTGGTRFTKAVLYQLSYFGILINKRPSLTLLLTTRLLLPFPLLSPA